MSGSGNMKAGLPVLSVDGVSLRAVSACLPPRSVDNYEECVRVYGDAAKAAEVVKATGIARRRTAEPGVTSLDLCCAAARRILDAVPSAAPGAIVSVTFTPARRMPCNACAAQARLGLDGAGLAAFDVNMACSGYAYGLYLAATIARDSGRDVLLLDGDVQTAYVDPSDRAVVPVLSDAGTATLVSPSPGAPAWNFAFMTKGEAGEALTLPQDGTLSMDGFGVFGFVAKDARAFIARFMENVGGETDAFVPHQANVYMVRQLAKGLGVPEEKVWISADELGNPGSSSVPVTMAWKCARTPPRERRMLLAGFGGGLSASVGSVVAGADCEFFVFDYGG